MKFEAKKIFTDRENNKKTLKKFLREINDFEKKRIN